MMAIRIRALPLLVLPGYMIFSSLQACSSSSKLGDTTSTSPLVQCDPNETSKKVNGNEVCCAGADTTNLACHTTTTAAPGKACPSVNATAPGVDYQITFDVCVHEACSGDRSCTEFPQKATQRAGTLVCRADSNDDLVWQWQDEPTVHEVERACVVTAVDECATGTEDDVPTYGYMERDTSFQYPYACGAYYGATLVHRREVLVLSSTCTTHGVTSPCPTTNF